MPLPIGFWAVIFGISGAVVGSFLNMAIWRLAHRNPATESVFYVLNNPRRSYCPKCGKPLSVLDNIPLISFLALGAKCRQCKQPIAWRYFWVEVLTASCFLALLLHFGATVEAVAYCLFFSALLAAFFIDLEKFIIPDELNTFALLVGIAFDVWAIASHQPGHTLLWGWLPRSMFGAMICAGVFVFIQLLGFVLFRKEAMGDGDVKLARAIGAMLPLSQALVSFLLAIAVGAVFGGLMLTVAAAREAKERKAESVRKAKEAQEDGETSGAAMNEAEAEQAEVPQTEEQPEAEEGISLGEIALRGVFYIVFVDLFIGLAAALRIPAAVKMMEPLAEESAEEDDFHPGPTHIPFGPYMVVGAFLAVFVAEALIRWYLAWTGLGNPPP